jgi:hypothetical protein
MTTEETADVLWEDAEAYTRKALPYLWPGADDSETAAHTLEVSRIRLMIGFLFPQLADWQRNLIEVLYWQRQILKCNFQIDRSWVEPAQRKDIERLTMENEQAYMSIVTTVKDKIDYSKLTSVQKELFRREFFEVQAPSTAG